jgi:ketosteroid isomerase-like protein
MSRENVEVVRLVVDAVNRRDADALTALLAADAEIVPIRAALEEGTAFRGPGMAARWFTAVDDAWEDLRAEISELRDLGERVVAFGRLRGRGRESGAAVDVEVVSVIQFRDGLVTWMRLFSNRAEALEAVGLRK